MDDSIETIMDEEQMNTHGDYSPVASKVQLFLSIELIVINRYLALLEFDTIFVIL